MTGPAAEPLSEPRLNQLLRALDWRFLLRQSGRPRALALGAPRQFAEGLALVADPAGPGGGTADLVVLGFPTRRSLLRAQAALRPGGEVACIWRRPRIAGVRRARNRLRRAGFEPARVYWAGPNPRRTPEFWLPLGELGPAAHLEAQRQPRSRAKAILPYLRRLAERGGALVPVCALARLPDPAAEEWRPDEIDEALAAGPVLLLTEGTESRHKVLCLAFRDDAPSLAVKCARTPATDRSLEREAEVLTELETLRPGFELAPRLRAQGTRVGRPAIAESVVPGQLPAEPLTQPTFERLALPVTDCLLELVDGLPAQPAPNWRRRLVEEPLDRFERCFAAQLEPGTADLARDALEALPDLPLAWEHRDCAVWNIHVAEGGGIGLFDWAGSEPRGLPGLDLAYFLATSAFMLDRLQMSDPPAVLESHRLLLDPTTPRGRVASACVAAYCDRLGLDPLVFPLLRLRSWIVKADPEDPAALSFAMLAAAELHKSSGISV